MGLEGPKAILYDQNDNVLIGQLPMAQALPVAIASDQSVLPTRTNENASFTVVAAGVALASNKSLLSIFNTDASRKVRIHAVWLCNVQTGSITGVMAVFELRRLTGAVPSAGTDLTTTGVEQLDTADVKDPDWTVRTGATVGTESTKIMRRRVWSTDDRGTGTLDQEGADYGSQTGFPLWGRYDGTLKPIVLRQNEGITVKCATATTAGTWDIYLDVSEEA